MTGNTKLIWSLWVAAVVNCQLRLYQGTDRAMINGAFLKQVVSPLLKEPFDLHTCFFLPRLAGRFVINAITYFREYSGLLIIVASQTLNYISELSTWKVPVITQLKNKGNTDTLLCNAIRKVGQNWAVRQSPYKFELSSCIFFMIYVSKTERVLSLIDLPKPNIAFWSF